MANAEIQALEAQIYELTVQLHALRREEPGEIVPNYEFAIIDGATTLLELFGERDTLLVIHNMGQGCRYCTLWADGFNGLLDHLEAAFSVVLVSKDSPAVQRQFALSRGWRFRLASHSGGSYITEQTVQPDVGNMPGAVVYTREGETIRRKNACVFGPGDLYCSAWHLLSLAGIGDGDWTPQYRYWQRPERLDDGGANVLD